MSIADKVAAEHVYLWSAAHCSCGLDVWGEDFPHHVAVVTEAAVRAQIAADIEAKRLASPTHLDGAYRCSARIASGGESR